MSRRNIAQPCEIKRESSLKSRYVKTSHTYVLMVKACEGQGRRVS